MDSHVIQLPTALTLQNAAGMLRGRSFFPEAPRQLVLSFHPKYSHFEPFALAMLAAWGDYWTSRDVPIQCVNAGAKGVAYARRMGLFEFLPDVEHASLVEHEESGRFVALHRIARQTDLSSLIAGLGGVLRSPHIIGSTQYTVAEMCRNVLEHARSPAFVCVQTYPNAKRVSIGIADCGIGVLESLRSNFGLPTDAAAVVAAAKPGVSGASGGIYRSRDNAGMGLFYARGLSRLTSRRFLLGSGSAAYRLAPMRPGGPPARNPTDERHDLYEELPYWQGTIVAVEIGHPETNHALMMRAIGAVTGVDKTLRDAKKRIRFR